MWASGCRVRINQSRNQCEIRRRFVISAVPQLSLKGPPAKNNEDARSFGKTWVSTKPPTNTFRYRRGRSREIVEGGRSQRILGREFFFAFDVELKIKDRGVKNCLVSAYQLQLWALFLTGVSGGFTFRLLPSINCEKETREVTQYSILFVSRLPRFAQNNVGNLFIFFFLTDTRINME